MINNYSRYLKSKTQNYITFRNVVNWLIQVSVSIFNILGTLASIDHIIVTLCNVIFHLKNNN